MTVYFIGGDFDRVKIGYTNRDPEERLRDLQVGCPVPLRVLASFAADQCTEGQLHSLFEDSWSHGEWFKITARLLRLIGYVKKYGTSDGWEEATESPERLAS